MACIHEMTHTRQGKSLLTDKFVAVKNARVHAHPKTKMTQNPHSAYCLAGPAWKM